MPVQTITTVIINQGVVRAYDQNKQLMTDFSGPQVDVLDKVKANYRGSIKDYGDHVWCLACQP